MSGIFTHFLEDHKYERFHLIIISIDLAIMSSFTVFLKGSTSKLTTNITPEIILDEKYEYSCGLLDFATYQSIPNISHSNNKFYFDGDEDNDSVIEVPTGCYEAVDILEYIKNELTNHDVSFDYKVNKNTLTTTVRCSVNIPLNYTDSVLSVLGFEWRDDEVIPATIEFESPDVIKISNSNVITVECNIASGAYVNGRLSHSIHEFAYNEVYFGRRIVEKPRIITYLPVICKRINLIEISAVDEYGGLIDFHGKISCRIHIKRDGIKSCRQSQFL